MDRTGHTHLKKGASSDADNYRPIFLTRVASKIFEQILKDAI